MNKTNFMFAKSSFIRNIAKIFDIGATTSNINNNSFDSEQWDAEAIRNDWEMVGNDLRGAIDEYKKRTTTR